MPGRISGQIAIIVIASLLVIHVVLTTAFFLTRDGPPPENAADELALLVEVINANPSETRAALVTEITNTVPRFDVALADKWPTAPARQIHDMESDSLASRLGPDYRV